MTNARLSAVRLGEVLAHVAFYSPEPLAAVLDALGYAPDVAAQVDEARGRLHWALDTGLADGGAEQLRAFVIAYDVVFRRLRARRPKLSSAAIDPRLEPAAAAPAPKHAGWVPLRASAPDAPRPAAAVPSYMQTPERLDTGAALVSSPATAVANAAPLAESNETWMVDGSQIREGLELPFVDPRLAPAFAPQASAGQATAPDAPNGATMFAPLDQEIRAALPFATSAPEDLDRYVRLTIALASDEDRAAVLARFGLSEEERQRLSRVWAERIARDPELAEKFRSRLRELRGR